MQKQFYSISILLFTFSVTFGQIPSKKWSLQDCIHYAYENNLNLLRNKNNVKLRENAVKQSKFDRLPTVNGSTSWNNGYGRTVDYTTNGYTTQNSSNINYGIGASVNLFNGFRKKHQIDKNKLDLQADLLAIESLKENLALQITSFYLNILFRQEQLQITKDNLSISIKQKERIEELVKAGKIPKGNLLEQQSQIAQKESAIVEAENNLELAYLDLYQALDIQDKKKFFIQKPKATESQMSLILDTYTNKYETILKQRPSLKMYDLKKKSAEKDIKIAKSNYYPSLNLSANIGSGYSNLRYDYENDPTTQQLVKVGKMSFSDQYNLNLSKSWGLSLHIPIFSKFQNKTAVSNAKIQLKDIEIQQQIEHNRLYKALQQAYTSAVASVKKYEAQQKTLLSLKETFHYVQEKYQLGLLSNFDYNEALNNLTTAQSNMLQAKYEYLFRTKILEFYSGTPLKL